MTTKADAKRRIVLPDAEPGDVYDVQTAERGAVPARQAGTADTARQAQQGRMPGGDGRGAADTLDELGRARSADSRAVILLDTNVLIYGFDPRSPFCGWARETIAEAVAGDGVAINAVSLAEICVGDLRPETVAQRIRAWDVDILDVPVAAAETCADAYSVYRQRRRAESGKGSPRSRCRISSSVPMHRSWAGRWRPQIAGRFATYFPDVVLKTP